MDFSIHEPHCVWTLFSCRPDNPAATALGQQGGASRSLAARRAALAQKRAQLLGREPTVSL